MSASDVAKLLATDCGKGLDPAEAARRLQAYAPYNPAVYDPA
ncbi:hypothetical protein CWO90_09360 [Bradyrhizobium sp. Leo121]|nr:hypothetical protein CWO90_09360 [Bradyrhizobium sp. Leo121]